jgi:hypothetical protein
MFAIFFTTMAHPDIDRPDWTLIFFIQAILTQYIAYCVGAREVDTANILMSSKIKAKSLENFPYHLSVPHHGANPIEGG